MRFASICYLFCGQMIKSHPATTTIIKNNKFFPPSSPFSLVLHSNSQKLKDRSDRTWNINRNAIIHLFIRPQKKEREKAFSLKSTLFCQSTKQSAKRLATFLPEPVVCVCVRIRTYYYVCERQINTRFNNNIYKKHAKILSSNKQTLFSTKCFYSCIRFCGAASGRHQKVQFHTNFQPYLVGAVRGVSQHDSKSKVIECEKKSDSLGRVFFFLLNYSC